MNTKLTILPNIQQLQTPRLRLRQWRDNDLHAFAEMNADEEVMRYFPSTYDREETRAAIEKYSASIEKQGWGFWAAETRKDCEFVGVIGLHHVDDLPIDECVEVGWRLARPYWKKGYATEAAVSCLEFAYTTLRQEEVVAITTVGNSKSRAVMDRLGMFDTGQNFLHPKVSAESGIQEHVLYSATAEQFYNRNE